MKTSFLSFIFSFLALAAAAQIKFEPGYIIGSDGQRTEVEIRNVDWSSNPTSFEYRVAGGTSVEGTLESIQEFGVTGGSIYRKFTVDIDRSSDIVAKLSKERNPEFKSETLFLRQLVTGKAVLYEYLDSGLKRYFYAMEGGNPAQLVYKRYMVMDKSGRWESGNAGANEQYKQQVFNELKCPSISEKDAQNLKYDRGSLMKIFTRFNECTGTAVPTTESHEQKSVTHLTIRPGVANNSFSIDNGTSTTDLESAVIFRIGAEVEVVMPFNKGLWSVAFEPAYQSYSSKASSGTVTIDYKSIDLGVSLRRYFFTNEKNRLYANLGFVFALPLDGKGAVKVGSLPLDISTGVNFTAGLGYGMGRFSAEFNYGFSRGLLGDYPSFTSSYGGPALILGYRIF